jgi:predicted nucleotidyltransferase
MRFGITEKTMGLIISALMEIEEIERASIFGSRGMGNYKKGSDVDIAIYGSSITVETVNRLSVILNEKLPIPYYFDIVHYDSLEHDGLKKHIEDFGIFFYECT